MLGEKILSFKLNWNKRYRDNKRASIPYSEAKKIGLIIKNDNPKHNSKIEKLIKSLIDDGKFIEVLCYQGDIINSKYSIPFFSFSKQELKWNGDINNAHFKKVLETKYDYLISISDHMDSVLDYILCKSPARLRIANAEIHSDKQADFLLSTTNQKDLGDMADQMIHYIKKIN